VQTGQVVQIIRGNKPRKKLFNGVGVQGVIKEEIRKGNIMDLSQKKRKKT
tara:strand:+ start:529 stop:678 length:150 start_codon:yes stop_codon:yes gene_type:complete